jgi:hypothetical protein
MLGAIAATPALAENDEVQFGSNIRVAPDSTIHDAVCFFCSVDIQGKATGDIVVFFGSVHVSGDAQHDLVNFFGDVKVDNNASVDHDLVSFFSELRLGENVRIGEDLVSMFGSLEAAPTVIVEGARSRSSSASLSSSCMRCAPIGGGFTCGIRSRLRRRHTFRPFASAFRSSPRRFELVQNILAIAGNSAYSRF